MKNSIRYTVMNEDGRPVIRAVPVPRRLETEVVKTEVAEFHGVPKEEHGQTILRRIRSMRLLDIR
ncbi:MAG TPA: hypothetical protein VFS96_01270 [Nitrolancea sp.]|nr:hypothetical protein [Nitrolancea sp.]